MVGKGSSKCCGQHGYTILLLFCGILSVMLSTTKCRVKNTIIISKISIDISSRALPESNYKVGPLGLAEACGRYNESTLLAEALYIKHYTRNLRASPPPPSPQVN